MDWIKKIEIIEAKLNLNTNQLAKTLNINSRYIYEIKSGKNKNPSAKFANDLIKVLGISPDWLFSDNDDGDVIKNNNLSLENEKLKKELEELKNYYSQTIDNISDREEIISKINETIQNLDKETLKSLYTILKPFEKN